MGAWNIWDPLFTSGSLRPRFGQKRLVVRKQ